MKNLIFPIALFILNFGYAQTTARVDPKPNRDLDIVLIPFGMEYPIIVGSLDRSGNAILTDNADFTQAPKTKQSDYTLKMSEVLGFCDNFNELLSQNENIDAVEPGVLFLWDNDELAGFIALVTDTSLFDWATDQNYGNPVVGSTFELIYVKTSFDFSGRCIQTFDTISEETQTAFNLDLHFKPGLNFMQYEIQSIFQPDIEDMNSFPEKVRITSHQKLPDRVIWMAYYY